MGKSWTGRLAGSNSPDLFAFRRRAVTLFLILALPVITGCSQQSQLKSAWVVPLENTELGRAVSVAFLELDKLVIRPSDYRLIGAEQFIRKNKYVWRVTFTPENPLPEDPSIQPVILGGEIFISIDLDSQEVHTTYGE